MSQPASNPFDKLPPHTVRSLRGMARPALRDWARRSSQQVIEIDLGSCTDKLSVLREIGRAFALPGWFGLNLDALYDALTDLPEQKGQAGYVVVLDKLPRVGEFDAEQRDALLDVFRDVAKSYAELGIPFRVFYS
jgi:RNAse (barnase) inhibitor barstar